MFKRLRAFHDDFGARLGFGLGPDPDPGLGPGPHLIRYVLLNGWAFTAVQASENNQGTRADPKPKP